MAIVVASWYHCSVKSVSRSSGRTAIAAAAYRSGARLRDEQTGVTHDYTRRHGVEASFIAAPEHAPAWAYDLETLWNKAQERDTRVNSCLAREVELALPSVIDAKGREQIAHDLADHLVERYGVAVSAVLHEPSGYGDERNYHAHILMTTRRMDEEGLGAKTRELDAMATRGQEVQHIREVAAELINDALSDAGSGEQVDHQSYKDRGIDHIATAHLGHEGAAMERRGEASRTGDENRAARAHNQELDRLVSELAELDAEIAREAALSFFPSASDPLRLPAPVAPSMSNAGLQVSVTPAQTPLTWEEEKRIAQSPENSELYAECKRQIETYGELQHYGLGPRGVELARLAALDFDELEYAPGREVTGWRDLVETRRDDRERAAPDAPEPER